MEQNSSIQINKVKYSENAGKISIEFSKTADGHIAEYSGVFDEPAEPEFYNALSSLLDPVLKILEFNPKEFKERIHPYGVTYKHKKDGDMMAIISSKLDIDETQIAINTPIRSCGESQEDENKTSCFDQETIDKLKNLLHQTENYLKGKRAQMSLFEQDGNESKKDEDPFRDNPPQTPTHPPIDWQETIDNMSPHA
ncbi:hypothetical protein [Megasphaera sueciensis]|uniref:hypothetical protein n=1 Tax=Megasphaera sueciensis TaxID=349094 RepID=UPI003D006F4B